MGLIVIQQIWKFEEESKATETRTTGIKDLETVVSLGKTVNTILGYLIYTLKPTMIMGSRSYLKRVKKAKVVKSVRAPIISLDIDRMSLSLPYRHLGKGAYSTRIYYSYNIKIHEKLEEVKLLRSRDNLYLSVENDFADEYPAKSLLGWIYTASLLEDNDIGSAISTTIPFTSIFSKIIKEAKQAFTGQYLGSVLNISVNDLSLTALYLKDEYLGIGKPMKVRINTSYGIYAVNYTVTVKVVDLTILRVGEIELANPNLESLKLLSSLIRKKDVLKLKTILVKTALAIGNFLVSTRMT